MKKNTDIRMAEKRRHIPTWLFMAYSVSLYPRLLLETFIRKDFGLRYYSLGRAFKLAAVLAVFPVCLLLPIVYHLLFPYSITSLDYDRETLTHFPSYYATWYIFIGTFLFYAIRRKREAKRNSGNTSWMGHINPAFYKISFSGKTLNPRFIEIVAEPLVTFFVGWLLYKLGQKIGTVIIVSSVFYSISYMYAYRSADETLMDIHDKKSQKDLLREIHFGVKDAPKAEEAEDVF